MTGIYPYVRGLDFWGLILRFAGTGAAPCGCAADLAQPESSLRPAVPTPVQYVSAHHEINLPCCHICILPAILCTFRLLLA
eukprot:COSAG05_NODE_1466_length_4804_cov_1.788523_2_plen_81_part_00